jgi:type IV secretion system protein TrbF
MSRPKQREAHSVAEGLWMEGYGTYIADARAWRRTAIVSLAVAAISTAGVVYFASQSQFIPYVVKVDKLGEAVAVSRADQAQRPDTTVITAQLGRWITDARTVYADASAQKALIREAYGMINQRGGALGVLNEHMRAHDPFQRARSETVSIDVQSVLLLAGDSWRIEWREETRSRDGKPLGQPQQYQATVTISLSAPGDEAGLRVNPMGVYIDALSWTQRL